MDSTIISVPSSTKNQNKERDPEAHQTKKGNNWYFGYKAHVGVDQDSGLVRTSIKEQHIDFDGYNPKKVLLDEPKKKLKLIMMNVPSFTSN